MIAKFRGIAINARIVEVDELEIGIFSEYNTEWWCAVVEVKGAICKRKCRVDGEKECEKNLTHFFRAFRRSSREFHHCHHSP